MNTAPHRAGADDLDDDQRRILVERDATFDQDRRDTVDAKEALRESRRKLEQLSPK